STRVLDTIVDGRSLDYTISEYPMFSLLLGDLHPHLMALPLTLLALGVAVALTLGPLPKRWGRGAALTVLAPAVALGALGFANIWDLPTYAVVLLAVGALRTAMEPPSGASSAEPDDAPAAADDAAATAKPHNSGQRRRWLLYLQWAGLALLATALLFSPFYLGIVASSRGAVASGSGGGPIAFWWGPGSRPLHLLLFWGPLLLAAGAFAWGLTAKLERRVRSQARAGLLVLPAIWVALELAAYRGTPDPASLAVIWVTRLWPLGPILAGVALLVGQVRAARNASNQSEATAARATALAVLLLGAALSLLAVCEWLYLRDVFNNRMNTVFKLYYQAWTLFSVGAAFGLYYIYEKRLLSRSGRGALGVTLGLALVGCLAVTPAALANRTGGFSRTPTLDGLAFLERVSPAESAAVVWLREQPGAAAILEAPGPQYSGYSQLSARTGVPSVLGWSGHERQWRGPSPAIGEREQDADQVYQAPNKSTILGILRKYGVEFVVVGPSERAKYPAPALAAFDAAFPAAFKQGSVTIYRVPGAGNGAAR
ncbi:MAG: DUF2298 domain-containing protein, partial [Chloroflexi bacterium]|nr:DUF2298 domain-containing protein [Chloroflexota bacterium]